MVRLTRTDDHSLSEQSTHRTAEEMDDRLPSPANFKDITEDLIHPVILLAFASRTSFQMNRERRRTRRHLRVHLPARACQLLGQGQVPYRLAARHRARVHAQREHRRREAREVVHLGHVPKEPAIMQSRQCLTPGTIAGLAGRPDTPERRDGRRGLTVRPQTGR